MSHKRRFTERLGTRICAFGNKVEAPSAIQPSSVLSLIHNWRLRKAGFTLVELLTVLAVVAILAAVSTPMLSAFKGNEVSQGVYNLSDIVSRSRAYAMSMNTYVYIGFASDSSTFSVSGSTVIGIVSSNYGTQIFPTSPTAYKPVSKLLRINNVKIASLQSSDQTNGDVRPTVQNSCKVADPTFNQGSPPYSFTLGGNAFSAIIQIDPQGAVSKIGGDAIPILEIGLRPVNGNQANFAALQISGLTGSVRIYRP